MVTQYEGETSDNIGMPSSDEGTLPPVEDFINKQFKDSKEGIPDWVVNSLTKAGCDMSFVSKGRDQEKYVD